jgi:glycosyltransferase involved in cell wall biosynthesis
MKLSAAIIVKNEELVIRRCIECVSKFADEIIIVDTGSTDRTKELAAEGEKVRLFDSVYFNKDTHYSDFSFSVAKNEAVERCTGDWIVWWDADDFIKDEGAAVIRRLAEESDTTKLYSFVISYGTLRFEHARMFARKSGVKFDEGHSCHEFLLGNGLVQEKRSDVVVEHLPGKKGIPSNTRNIAILEKDYFERHRRDQRTIFYLANSYKECGRWDEAVEFYNKYLEVSHWKEERFFACYYKAQVFSLIGNIEDARNACLECIKEDYRFAEPYCLLGDLCAHTGDLERAIKWYELALATPFPEDSRLFVNRSCYSSYPKAKIAEVRAKMGVPREVSVGSVEATAVASVGRVYGLPEDRRQAVMAIFALALCASEGKDVGVLVENEWQKEILDLYGVLRYVEAADEVMGLSLPEDMHGRHAVSWYCRSAGYVTGKWGVLRLEGDRENGKGIVIGASPSWDGWQAVADILGSEGYSVNLIWDSASVRDAEKVMKDAGMFVGIQGWLQHLAASMTVDSIVFWDQGTPEEEGWPDQCNVSPADGVGLKGLEPETVVSMIKRRMENGDRGVVRSVEAAAV